MHADGLEQRSRTADLRKHVLDAIALNRVSDFHFPACYLGVTAERVDADGSLMVIPYGPHVTDSKGAIDVAAIAILADMSLSSAMRPHVDPTSRMATVTLHLHFTGVAARERLFASGHLEGLLQGPTGIPGTPRAGQGRCSAELRAGVDLICLASATFANPPLPPGVTLAPFPWQCRSGSPTPLAMRGLTADERRIMRRAEHALRSDASAEAQASKGFIERFWGLAVDAATEGKAAATLVPGPHIANRVGHVQGGVLFGIATATAQAALPAPALLTGASAWYISPGDGVRLRFRSTLLQLGKTVAVVRTEVFAAGRRRVLEMVSGYAPLV